MRLDEFTLEITGGNERTNGQVLMNHGQGYEIVLRNHSFRNADVELSVDGNSIGTFRVNSHGTVRLERPENDNGKFTFFRLNSTEAKLGGIQNNDAIGLITATFRTGRKKYVPPVEVKTSGGVFSKGFARRGPSGQSATLSAGEAVVPMGYQGSRGIGYSAESIPVAQSAMFLSAAPAQAMYHATGAGGTALAGHSAQRFNSVEALEYDGVETTINLRLVEDLSTQASTIRPITTRVTANPIPPKA